VRPTLGSNINKDEGVKIVSPTTGQLLQLQSNGLWENKTKAQVLGGTSSQFVKGDGSLDSTAYVPTSREVIAGAGLTGGGALTGNVTLSHADTSSQASVDNSNGNVIQDVTLDTYGHITALASTNLDNRYYTETEIDSTLTNYQLRSEKAQPNGYASLDINGKVPLVQINDALIGNVNFQGLWNAATNTPTLANPPASGTKGYYYIVSTAGTFAGISFEVGDWIISNGTAWGKVDNTDAVSSVFGRTGNVTASNGDYNTSQVTENTNLYFTNARAIASVLTGYSSGAGTISSSDSILSAIQKLNGNIGALVTGVSSVNGQTGVVVLTTTNIAEGTNLYYTEARVNANTNVAANTAARHAAVTLGTANGLSLSTQQLSLGLASAGVTGALSGTDWSTFNNKQNALTNPVTGTGSAGQVAFWSSGSQITGENNLFWNSTTDRLGIGTNNPQYKLDITNGDIRLNMTSGDWGIIFEDDGTLAVAGTKIWYGNSDGIQYYDSYWTGAGAGHLFRTNLNGTTQEVLKLLNTGNAIFYNNVTASSFIRSGGTSAQFLKADGSVDSNAYITGNQTITLSGDATGSGTTAITVVLANSGVVAGTYNNSATQVRPFTVDAKGRITSIGTAVTITPAFSDVTGKPTTLAGYGITDAYTQAQVNTLLNGKQNALSGTGFVKISGTTISYDNSTYYLASNPSAFIALTALSGIAPIQYNNTTGAISITQASGSTNGFLSSTDWNTFNNKTSNVGTVTSVAALTLGTSGTDLSSSVANGTTTPVITLNVPTASAANRGALSAADWTTFNSKENAITAGTTAQYYRGDKTFQTLNTAAVPESGNLYYTEARVSANTNVAANTAARHNAVTLGTANGLSLSTQQLSLGLASSSANGALSSTDWTTFNNKQNALTNPVTGTGTSGQVAYFNGTSSITGESNLFWDATNDRLGIGTASPTAKLEVNVGLNSLKISGRDTYVDSTEDATNANIYVTQAGVGDFGQLAGNLVLQARTQGTVYRDIIFAGGLSNGDALMTILGEGNVGIGTTSPASILDLTGSAPVLTLNRNGGAFTNTINFNLSATNYASIISNSGSGEQRYSIGPSAGWGGFHTFYTDTVERMRLNSSGNLGLGVTPSAWSVGRVLQINTSGAFVYGSGNNTIYGLNAFFQSGWKYTNTAAASLYEQFAGAHQWYTAPSGTAGNAISFTQAMTLGSNSGLSIGTPSAAPSQGLLVQGAVTTGIFNQNTPVNFSTDGTDNSPALTIFKNTTIGTRQVFRVQSFIGAVVTVASINAAGAATFSSSVTAGSQLSILGSDGGGKQLVFTGGTTKYNFMIAAQQNVNNALEITPSSAAGGSTFSTPAVVVTGTGNVGIGTTSPGTKLQVNSTAGTYGITNTNGTVTIGTYIEASNTYASFGTSSNHPIGFFTNNNAPQMYINTSGNVGIGTVSPISKFQIGSVGSTGYSVSNGLAFGNGTQASALDVNASGLNIYSTNNIIFFPNTAERMRIWGSSGNVNIGSTPSSDAGFKLDVNGTGRFVNSTTFQGVFSGWSTSGANTSSGAIQLGINAAYRGVISYAADGDTTFTFDNSYDTASAIMRFRMRTAGTAVTAMTILGSGNVGIGTASASQKLEVSGGAIIASGFGNRAAGTGKALEIGMDGTNAVLQAFDRTANAFIPIYINSSQTIIPTGNVLIGTTSDVGGKLGIKSSGTNTAPLVIQRSANTNTLASILETSAGDASFNLRNAAGSANIQLLTNGASSLNGGNVLIGTSSDDTLNRLQVNGNAKVDGNILLGSSVSRFVGFGTGTENPYVQFAQNGSMLFNVETNDTYTFQRGGASFVTFTGNGIETFAGGITTVAPTGTNKENWRLGRALLATSSDPEDRWIRVQLGTRIYDILAIDRGLA
jgi:hypothetical protein